MNPIEILVAATPSRGSPPGSQRSGPGGPDLGSRRLSPGSAQPRIPVESFLSR